MITKITTTKGVFPHIQCRESSCLSLEFVLFVCLKNALFVSAGQSLTQVAFRAKPGAKRGNSAIRAA